MNAFHCKLCDIRNCWSDYEDFMLEGSE